MTLASEIAESIMISARAVLEQHGIRDDAGDLAREIGNNAAAPIMFRLEEIDEERDHGESHRDCTTPCGVVGCDPRARREDLPGERDRQAGLRHVAPVPPCRCGWVGDGDHPCHRCRRPGSSRLVAMKACVVIEGGAAAQPELGARETWSCDACWDAFIADGSFRGGRG